MRYDNVNWTLRELEYVCKQEKSKWSETQIKSWANAIYRELNRINADTLYNERRHRRQTTPFSEYYAHDKYSNYFDEENEF